MVEEREATLTRREKRLNRIKNRLFKEEDIKYQGPLSYRALRIIAWVAFAIGQFALLATLGAGLIDRDFMNETVRNLFSSFSNIATPLFIIASFGLILSGRRKFDRIILLYGLAYLGIGAGFCLFYLRYVDGLFLELGATTSSLEVIWDLIDDKANINVFADLFAFVLLHFFINYTPKRFFQGKKLIIFRLFVIFPILFVLGCYVLKILAGYKVIKLPIYAIAFLTTKNPLIFFMFVTMSLWIKNRERFYIRLGATREEYQKFLLTKRNSLSFSLHLSMTIFITVLVDFFGAFILGIILNSLKQGAAEWDMATDLFGLGQSFVLLFTIPFILLYSYTRDHKDIRIDIFIPIGGIGLTAIAYIECIYQIILQLFNKS